jgi:hypothetical protein
MRDNSTNVDPIQEAVGEMKSQEQGAELSYTKVAEKHGVSRHTLARRCKGIQTSSAAKATNQQKLNPQQEHELLKYIEVLSERGLAPTREMIRNFASGIAQEHVGKG